MGWKSTAGEWAIHTEAAMKSIAIVGTALIVCVPWTCCAAAEPLAPFVDVAAQLGLTRVHTSGSLAKGYIPEAKGGGTAALDFDRDGDQDLYWVNGEGGGHALYRNDGDHFFDVGEALGIAGRGWGMGATSADFDNDGDQDLYATQLRENLLYRNDGDRFAEVATAAGVATSHWSTGAAWADYDRDGDLDLYVASYAVFDSTEVERLGAQWKGVEVFVGPRGLVGAADVFYRNDGDEFIDITAW
ncbi:MAG: VCBS repeat-containing protein, partial [Gemmatimonadetes bacterium]|nr:VCBS repeat-containing protein [Gemmatimonadota bacterium]